MNPNAEKPDMRMNNGTSAFAMKPDRPLRFRALFFLLLCAMPFFLLCGGKSRSKAGNTVQIKGSDTMVNLAQAWAEQYKLDDPSTDIEVSGGGSGVGIAALSKGAIDIASASRNMKPDEIEQTRSNTGKEPKEFIVGYDALAVFVHPDNPLSEITLGQLAEIFEEKGNLTEWADLGVRIPGAVNDKILRVSRQSSSGTYEFFRKKVMENRDFKLGSLDMNGSKEVVELIANTRTAIGYSGMGYATAHVKMLRIAPNPGEPACEPSVANVHNKTYPLARSLLLYTLGEPVGVVKKWIDWILSPAGQAIVAETGYVPIFGSLPNPVETQPVSLPGHSRVNHLSTHQQIK